MARLYDFKPEDAYEFAREMNIAVHEHGGNLHFKTCPYCKGRGQGNENTFAINMKNGTFNCLRASCGAKGNMITLSKDFGFSLGKIYDEYYTPKKYYKPIMKKSDKVIEPKPAAVQYLESRGISQKIAERYEITTQKGKDNILVFPFRDSKGDLWFAKYRKTDHKKGDKEPKEWCEKGRKPILFGMYQCNMENKTLIFTEGQIDSLSVAEAGIENAVSVPTGAKGMTWIPHCWDWMRNFEEIIVFGDYEKGFITLLDDIRTRFSDLKIRHVREEDYKDCKDANDILRKYGKDQIRKCIENAEMVPIRNIIDLADVPDVDIYKIEKLRTGIRQVDKLLIGGLPFGGVSILTGKSGKGKSVLASQILVQAIFQNHICFAYSGELPNHLFRAWLDFQVAGRRHVVEYTNSWGEVRYNVSKENRAEIANWYRGKCYLYDNSNVDGEETESLLTLTEKAITQYGASVILIDNLMTALDFDKTSAYDKYDKQSRFVKKLVRIALDFNVLILLVAHKRKNNFSQNENDEIAGSSDITNLGMITMSYDSDNEIGQDQRLLKVAKNRLFGKVETSGFVLNYDEKSKRIYGEGDDVDVNFGWSSTAEAEGFELLQDDVDAPFN